MTEELNMNAKDMRPHWVDDGRYTYRHYDDVMTLTTSLKDGREVNCHRWEVLALDARGQGLQVASGEEILLKHAQYEAERAAREWGIRVVAALNIAAALAEITPVEGREELSDE